MEYQLFGVKLFSAYRFSTNLVAKMASDPSPNSPILYFTCNQLPPFSVDWKKGKLIYSRSYTTPKRKVRNNLYHFDEYDVFRFGEGADFFIRSDHIDCHLRNLAYQDWMEAFFFASVLAFWLERQGFAVLHASAIAVDQKAIAFPSYSGRGKSTLATAFLQADGSLLTDDILPIKKQMDEYWGYPGLPQINLWQNQINHFMENGRNLEEFSPDLLKQVVPINALKNGVFCDEKQRLACIYIPNKATSISGIPTIKITPYSPSEAVIELLRHSYVPSEICEKMKWQPRRLEFFARLAEQIPVRRLTYPIGFDHLPRVTEAIMRDLKDLRSG